MTDTADRIGKLDELYDKACRILLGDGEWTKETGDFWASIIDRWLAVRESDRQYAIRRYESGIDYQDENLDVPLASADTPTATRPSGLEGWDASKQ